jgi:5-methylcytosine-specific restriction endonuclease McrA
MSAKGTTYKRKTQITHCKRGHKFSADNTYLYGGKRICRKCRKLRLQLWIKNNYERMITLRRKWREENPERVKSNNRRNRSSLRQWRKDHPESVASYRATRRTSVTKAGGSFTSKQWIFLCKIYGNKCLCCRRKKCLEADHVIPVSKGGSSNISNIQPLCRSCNAKKGTKTTDYRNNLKVPYNTEE